MWRSWYDNWDSAADEFEYTVSDGSTTTKGSVDVSIDGYSKPKSEYDDWHVGKSSAEWLAVGVVGNNKVFAGNGNDDVVGSSSAKGDILSGGGGRDWLWGLGGDDILLGNQGQDRLFGGSGSDSLFGGTDNDRLMGGAGADRFVFEKNSGADVIVDFNPNQDQIVIDLDNYATFDDISSRFVRKGDDLLIRLNSDDSIKLLDVSLPDLDESHFVFV